MHTGQRAIEQPKSPSRRRGGTFEELGVALGISNSSLRRWARRGRIIGAHFIRGRWVLLGKLTPKRVESIRSGLNLHEHLPPVPKKWKWRSKEERIALLEVEIQRLEETIQLLPISYRGYEGMERRRLWSKQMELETRQLKLKGEEKYPDEEAWMAAEKKRKKVAQSKMGNGYQRRIVRKKND